MRLRFFFSWQYSVADYSWHYGATHSCLIIIFICPLLDSEADDGPFIWDGHHRSTIFKLLMRSSKGVDLWICDSVADKIYNNNLLFEHTLQNANTNSKVRAMSAQQTINKRLSHLTQPHRHARKWKHGRSFTHTPDIMGELNIILKTNHAPFMIPYGRAPW